ncbi:MAG: biotin synthase BioB [Nitrososphaeraceae archaeon]
MNKVISGKSISFEEAGKLLCSQDILSLAFSANVITRKFNGNSIDVESLLNAKSGKCPEDCSFCAQSSFYNTKISKYPLLPKQVVIVRAKEAERQGASSFCLVCAYRSPPEEEFRQICDTIEALKKEVSIDINASLGFMTLERARKLKSLGIKRYNHNLEASDSFFSQICKTHDFADRVKTAKIVKEAGLELCCGGIIGMGETVKQRIELAFALAALNPDEVPINILIPNEGTPMAQIVTITPEEAIRTIAVWRFIMPKVILKLAGGREVHFSDNGRMALRAGANGIISGGYLTTGGNEMSKDLNMIHEIGIPA